MSGRWSDLAGRTFGSIMVIKEATEQIGISYNKVIRRILSGESPETAIRDDLDRSRALHFKTMLRLSEVKCDADLARETLGLDARQLAEVGR